jgi:hypothetical protein
MNPRGFRFHRNGAKKPNDGVDKKVGGIIHSFKISQLTEDAEETC